MMISARQMQAKRRNDLIEELARRAWQRDQRKVWDTCLDAATRAEWNNNFEEYMGTWDGPASAAYDQAKEFEKHKKDCRKEVRAVLKDLKELRE